jgi:hypothetical protein
MIRTIFVRASLRNGLRALYHEFSAHRTCCTGRFCFDGVFTIGIIGA